MHVKIKVLLKIQVKTFSGYFNYFGANFHLPSLMPYFSLSLTSASNDAAYYHLVM